MTGISAEPPRPRWDTAEQFYALRRTIFYPKTDLDAPDHALRALKRRSPDELGITREAVARAGAACFGGKPSVSAMAEQGTFHRLFLMTFADGRRFVLRANGAGELYRDHLMRQDAWIAARLTDVGAPAVRCVDLSREICPFDYEIIDETAGGSLTRYDEGDGILPQLRLLGAKAAEIHKHRLAGFGFLDVRPLADARDLAITELRGVWDAWRDYVELHLDRHVDYCRRNGAIAEEEQRRILALFTEHARLWDDAPSALLHGDLGNHNVFTDGARITAIIDWEDCLAGDPVFDIAFWATFHPEPRHAAFLDGYRAVAALPADFALRFWLYFLRVSLAKTVHRHRFGYTDRPGRQPASRRIQLSLERLETS